MQQFRKHAAVREGTRWPCRGLWEPGCTWAFPCQHCAGVPQPDPREKGSVEAAGWAPGGWLVEGSRSQPPVRLPARSLGRQGGPRAEEPRGGRWGFPRALREGEHSESKAKRQSRLGSSNSPWGWAGVGPGKGWAPGFLTPPPSRNLQGHGEIQAGISAGWMTHPPPPTHTPVSKPPFSCQGFQRGSPGGGTAPVPKLPRLGRSPLSDTDEGP